ncbi:MAG: type II toxin-antitoxin system VapC family toxin [Gemmatimonadaceae bacterium]|nr:type II toxin-antitoxin system VapC family toxin [Gemmatimonadaceae bacterium]
MVLLDVNVLVSAMREDAPRHAVARDYLERLRRGPEPFGLSDLVLSGTMRVLTHPRVFVPPTPPDIARAWVAALRATPNVILVSPGPRHWELFVGLLERSAAIGNLVADAWHAALAIEHGCDWISDDADFGRFPDLRWRRPD